MRHETIWTIGRRGHLSPLKALAVGTVKCGNSQLPVFVRKEEVSPAHGWTGKLTPTRWDSDNGPSAKIAVTKAALLIAKMNYVQGQICHDELESVVEASIAAETNEQTIPPLPEPWNWAESEPSKVSAEHRRTITLRRLRLSAIALAMTGLPPFVASSLTNTHSNTISWLVIPAFLAIYGLTIVPFVQTLRTLPPKQEARCVIVSNDIARIGWLS